MKIAWNGEKIVEEHFILFIFLVLIFCLIVGVVIVVVSFRFDLCESCRDGIDQDDYSDLRFPSQRFIGHLVFSVGDFLYLDSFYPDEDSNDLCRVVLKWYEWSQQDRSTFSVFGPVFLDSGSFVPYPFSHCLKEDNTEVSYEEGN